MASGTVPQWSHADYTIACVCATGFELAAIEGMLDEIRGPLPTHRDHNVYTLGRIGVHNIVVGVMSEKSNNAAARMATQLQNDFPSIRFGMLVGIGGGIPGRADIHLGDVVISQPTDTFGGVVQYDLGKRLEGGRFQRTGLLNKPPSILSAAVRKLQSQYIRQGHRLLYFLSEMLQRYPRMQADYAFPREARDELFHSSYSHISGVTCGACDRQQLLPRTPRADQDPHLHYGTIGSANFVVADASFRDELREDMNLICLETEAAGLMDNFPCLVIRGICDYADSHKNHEWQFYAAAVAAAYMKELLLSIPGKQVIEISNTLGVSHNASDENKEITSSAPPQVTDEDIFASLAFPEMGVRRFDIQNPHPNTCRWILYSVDYQEWESQKNGLLWLIGKPGAGKSTIMSFLFTSLPTQRFIDTDIQLEFFFSARGAQLQRNFIGMLRSLLNQLLRHAASSRNVVRKSYGEKCVAFGYRSKMVEWHERELKELFVESLVIAAQHHKIRLLVDALDEAGESAARSIATYLHFLSDRVTAASLPVKICVSCRHYPMVFMGQGIKVCVEDNNHADIISFIADRFAFLHAEIGGDDHAQWLDLQNEILKRAKGVFQWVSLVMGIIESNVADGLTVREVQLEIQKLPEEISDVYEHIILNVIKARFRSQAFLLFQWVSLAEKPLSLGSLRYALAATYAVPKSEISPTIQSAKTSDFIETDDNMRKRIHALSGGLIEVIGRRVQVVHQTVNEFLLHKGLALLSPFYKEPDGPYFREQCSLVENSDNVSVWHQCQSRMYWTCLKYMASEAEADKGYANYWSSEANPDHKFLIEYAALFALVHAKKAGQHRRQNVADQVELLKRADPVWTRVNDSTCSYDWDLPNFYTKPLHLAAGAGLYDLVTYSLTHGEKVDREDEIGRTALHFAARGGHESIAAYLIAAGADVNKNMEIIRGTTHEIMTYGRIPLVIAAKFGHVGVFHMLLSHADLRAEAIMGEQALQAASANGHVKIVQSLLQSGVDVNAHREHYGTALPAACAGHHRKCVQLLLDAGADINASGERFGNALEAAIKAGDEHIVQLLINEGADIDAHGHHGRRALRLARYCGKYGIEKLLLDAKASDTRRGDWRGKSFPATEASTHETDGHLTGEQARSNTALYETQEGLNDVLAQCKEPPKWPPTAEEDYVDDEEQTVQDYYSELAGQQAYHDKYPDFDTFDEMTEEVDVYMNQWDDYMYEREEDWKHPETLDVASNFKEPGFAMMFNELLIEKYG